MNNAHNIELMRRHFLYEERGDSAAVLAEMCDPPTYYTPARSDHVTHDPDRIREIHTALFNTMSDMKFSFRSLFATDTHGCAELISTGRHTGEWRGIKPTGKELRIVGCSIFTFKDGKIESESVYSDVNSVLRQLGLVMKVEKALA